MTKGRITVGCIMKNIAGSAFCPVKSSGVEHFDSTTGDLTTEKRSLFNEKEDKI
jgi:hypothetical protein